MIKAHSIDGFQSDSSGFYCYLQDADGNQIGTIEVDDHIAHVYVVRSDLASEFDFDQFDQQDDDLIDSVIETLFDPLNWVVSPSLVQQLIDIAYSC